MDARAKMTSTQDSGGYLISTVPTGRPPPQYGDTCTHSKECVGEGTGAVGGGGQCSRRAEEGSAGQLGSSLP